MAQTWRQSTVRVRSGSTAADSQRVAHDPPHRLHRRKQRSEQAYIHVTHAMFTMAADAEAAAGRAAIGHARRQLGEDNRQIRAYGDWREANSPFIMLPRVRALHAQKLSQFERSAPARIRDAELIARQAYRQGWRRRHRWKLAMVRVRAFLAMQSLMADIYVPGGAGAQRTATHFATCL